MLHPIVQQAFDAFQSDLASIPLLTLRGGNAVDSYDEPPPYDPAADQPNDAYLEQHTFWGLIYLDAASWRHYLPRLIDYALRNMSSQAPGTMAIDGLLWSLRPPDRDPPRLASLSAAQEAVIVTFLERLAFDEASLYQEDAMLVLEEWWLPNARYHKSAGASEQGQEPV